MPLSPSAQTSRLTSPHATNAAKSNHLGWGFGKRSVERPGPEGTGDTGLDKPLSRRSRPSQTAREQQDGPCQQGSLSPGSPGARSLRVPLFRPGHRGRRTGSPCARSRAQPAAPGHARDGSWSPLRRRRSRRVRASRSERAFEVLPGQAGLVPALLQHPSLPT